MSTKVTFSKLREDPEEYPAAVEFAVTPTGVVETSERAADDRPLEARIEERLALGPRTKNKLADETGRSGADVDAALSNLFAARRITTATVKVRGVDRKAFALRP